MICRIEFTVAAKRALTDLLPESVAVARWGFIRGPLAENPERVGKPLRGPLEGRYTARRGEFRVGYRIRDYRVVVSVIHIANPYRASVSRIAVTFIDEVIRWGSGSTRRGFNL